jgi:hypothetical protein
MISPRFVELLSEFQALAKRLNETPELSERIAILKQVRPLIDEMEGLIEMHQARIEKELLKIRSRYQASTE